jgi:hypothetical protein
MSDKFTKAMQKIFKECDEWLTHPQHQNKLKKAQLQLQACLEAQGQISSKAMHWLEWLAHYFGIAACEAYGRKDLSTLTLHLNAAVGYRTLISRLDATFNSMMPQDDIGGRPTAFKDSMNASFPGILGHWAEARICATGLIEVAEKDQRLRIPESRRLRHGTVDAFLIDLFSQAFSIKTVFQSLTPIHPVYTALLQHWNSLTPEDFIAAMQGAAEFHIERSKDSTNSISYEFDYYFTRIFPIELLVVQAFRHRDNLPATEVGHPLVDGTWATIMQLPNVPQDPLLLAVETRFKIDYPLFR